MFNIKWGGIAAGTAFAVALALSLLLGQTGLLIALLRAAIFAAVFFALGTAAWTLINTFVPELLSPVGAKDIASSLFSTGQAGSRVNITVDDAHNAALPEQEHGAPGAGEVGNFNDLFTHKEDVDQIPATGYTEGGEFASETEEIASAFADIGLNEEDEAESGEFSMDFSAFVPGGLGDDGAADESDVESDSDLGPFSFFPDGAASTSYEEPAPERKVTRNKPMKLEGDFDAKEIAAGLRTVLQKDKK